MAGSRTAGYRADVHRKKGTGMSRRAVEANERRSSRRNSDLGKHPFQVLAIGARVINGLREGFPDRHTLDHDGPAETDRFQHPEHSDKIDLARAELDHHLVA